MSILGSLFRTLFPKKKPSRKKPKSSKPRNSTSTVKAANRKPTKPSTSSLTKVVDGTPKISYRIPAKLTDKQKLDQSERAWHPPGRSAKVAGRTIASGMIYVGQTMEPISGWQSVDPALINPQLPVSIGVSDTSGIHLTYWPNYSDLHPESRIAYLDWLAAGRPAGAPIGYVFLFFYGLERRVLFDSIQSRAARAEIPSVIAEVERLLSLYPDERSFQGYASDFLTAARLTQGPIEPREIEPPMQVGGWELPLSAKMALGTFAATRQPIPPIWAISWLYSDPQTRLRTPARRCQQEFMTLFRLDYQAQFGPGMVIDPPRARLSASYRPASAGFSGSIPLQSGELPDVSKLQKPQLQLRDIADRVTLRLDDYSRAIGNGMSSRSPAALAFLPEQLGDIARFPTVAPLAHSLSHSLNGGNSGTVDVATLLKHFPEFGSRPSQKQANALARLVWRLGYGLEPDPTIDRRSFVGSTRAGIYRLDRSMNSGSRDLSGPTAMLSLCALVAAADGAVTQDEQRIIFGFVSRAYTLMPQDEWRLQAHLAWLAEHPGTLAGARKRLRLLSPDQAEKTGRFLVSIAGADGQVEPAEVRLLTRIYFEMGLDAQSLHTHLHTYATDRDAFQAARSSESTKRTRQSTVELDPAFLQQVQRETVEIAGILGHVFAEDDSPSPVEMPDGDDDEPEDVGNQPIFTMIDLISSRPSWPMSDVREMAAVLGLMVSGAIETINDRAIVLGVGPALECDDEWCDVIEPAIEALLAQRQ